MQLGKIGIWSTTLRRADPTEISEAAAELDELGFGTLWISGGAGGPLFDDVERLLRATERAVVATGVLNLWSHEPADVAAEHARLSAAYGRRIMLGIGVSHGPMVSRLDGAVYAKPLAKTRQYLDALDATPVPVPVAERLLGALGPRMLELARERSAGAHPYLVTVDHTAFARRVLGDDALLAPEQMVILDDDSTSARESARAHLERYLRLPNYTNNLMKFGLSEDDLLGGGSDRLVDAVVAWGDLDAVASRIEEHLDAGADHVGIQVLRRDAGSMPRNEWRQLAQFLDG